ncbi:cochlin-like [Haliotis rubra]|uniref:cochlin-like n=1 Tax=Haliotis rubra TaxID=36100 RepID=UPI001EE4FB85|nr:cochlin-like [Haliotis rubra]
MDFVKSIVTTFDVSPQRARFSVITYGRGTYDDTAFGLDAYTDEVDVVNAITNIPYTAGDYTDTGLGIKFMREKQMLPKQRAHAAHIAIVMTDGQSQNSAKTQKEAAKSRDAGINMFAVGVGLTLSQKELLDIAGDQDRVYTVDDYKACTIVIMNKRCLHYEEISMPRLTENQRLRAVGMLETGMAKNEVARHFWVH